MRGLDDDGDFWLGVRNRRSDDTITGRTRAAFIVTGRKTTLEDAIESGEYAASKSFILTTKRRNTYTSIDGEDLDDLKETFGESKKTRIYLYDVREDEVMFARKGNTLEFETRPSFDNLIENKLIPVVDPLI